MGKKNNDFKGMFTCKIRSNCGDFAAELLQILYRNLSTAKSIQLVWTYPNGVLEIQIAGESTTKIDHNSK